jgi:hypothetical protein
LSDNRRFVNRRGDYRRRFVYRRRLINWRRRFVRRFWRSWFRRRGSREDIRHGRPGHIRTKAQHVRQAKVQKGVRVCVRDQPLVKEVLNIRAIRV